MNVLGIQLGDVVTSVALREGDHAPRQIGDGRRFVLPSAVTDHHWGSEAVSTAGAGWNGLKPLQDRVGLLRRLQVRLEGFCGGGFRNTQVLRTVIATNAPREELVDAANQAGFAAPIVISPLQAAIAGWLFRHARFIDGERTVAVAVIGDLVSEVGVYRVRVGSQPAILKSSAVSTCTIGIAHWAAEVIQDVRNHRTQSIPSNEPLELWMAAVELGDRVRRTSPSETVAWIGPHEEDLLTPLFYGEQDLYGYQSTRDFALWMSRAVRQAIAASGYPFADVLLLAGIGAGWPIAPDAFTGLPDPFISADPASDVTFGAVWWPALQSSPESVTLDLPSRKSPGLPRPDRSSSSKRVIAHEAAQNSSNPAQSGSPADEVSRLLHEELDQLKLDES